MTAVLRKPYLKFFFSYFEINCLIAHADGSEENLYQKHLSWLALSLLEQKSLKFWDVWITLLQIFMNLIMLFINVKHELIKKKK